MRYSGGEIQSSHVTYGAVDRGRCGGDGGREGGGGFGEGGKEGE